MVNVQLPNLAVESEQTALQAELRTSLRFGAGWMENGSVDGLSAQDLLLGLATRQQGEEEEDARIWIVPAPACRLSVSVRLLGGVEGWQLEREVVAGWIEGCNIWDRLGLRVQHCSTTAAVGDATTFVFSMQHPDLSAMLLGPTMAEKRSELEGIDCCLELSTARESYGRRGRKRKRDGGPGDGGGRQYCCRTTMMEKLVGAAVTALVTGTTRHFMDVRLLQRARAFSLVKIAPLVFSVAYVKSISERARHITVIANAVMAMNEAQSPRLRRRVESLSQRGSFCPRDTIHNSVWKCILSHTRLPHVPGPRATAAGTFVKTDALVEYQENEPIVSDYSNHAAETMKNDAVDETMVWLGEDISEIGNESLVVDYTDTGFEGSFFDQAQTCHAISQESSFEEVAWEQMQGSRDVVEFGSEFGRILTEFDWF